uniref:Uncharacterized protein n=1 Tax=Tanacetum cinerariifolium TaxID=118510 RepID=A0A6L2NLR9_TANCI|nr:hypothetical protein [Tanacetum cinerariifolium]
MIKKSIDVTVEKKDTIRSPRKKLDIKKATKSSKDDFILKQRTKGTGEGSSVVLDNPDELSDSSSSTSKNEEGFLSINDKASQEKSDNERTKTDIFDVNAAKIQVVVAETEKKKPEVPLISSQTLSCAKYGKQLLSDNVNISINDVLQDLVETDTQSMVEVPILEENLLAQETQLVNVVVASLTVETTHLPKQQPPQSQPKQSKTKIILKKPKKHDEKVNADVVLKRLTRLEKKVAEMFKIDYTDMKLMQKVTNIQRKDVMIIRILLSMLTKTQRKEKRKDSNTSSSKKGKDQMKSSKEAKAPSNPSATKKAVDHEELIQDDVVDDEELVL